MYKIILSLLTFIIAMSVEAQVAPKLKVRQIHIEYKSPNKSLEIKDTSLVVSEKKDVFDNPVSSVPSSSKVEERNYTLSKKEVYDLVKFLRCTGGRTKLSDKDSSKNAWKGKRSSLQK